MTVVSYKTMCFDIYSLVVNDTEELDTAESIKFKMVKPLDFIT